MKISVRFAEYTISGGLFWICIVIFLTLSHIGSGNNDAANGNASLILQGSTLEQAIQFWAEIIKIFLATLPENANYTPNIIANLLTGLGIIAVFCTGILLDIISPLFFTPFEIILFKRGIRYNRHWLKQAIEDHDNIYLYEYNSLLNESLLCWNKPNNFLKQRHHYVRFRSFLFTNVYASFESEKLEDLKDRIHLWHMSRALGAAIFILALLLNITEILPKASSGISTDIFYIPLCYLISVLMAIGSYSRMCDTLFTVTYFANKKNSADPGKRLAINENY